VCLIISSSKEDEVAVLTFDRDEKCNPFNENSMWELDISFAVFGRPTSKILDVNP
jgi:enoyl-CoA hydratase/carnithine racemase